MATVTESQPTTKNFAKLRKLLEELFQMDQADLDFGIFRIMNAKRDEVVQFLDKDLLPQVNEAFSQYQSADKSEIKTELDEAIGQAKSLGADPDTIPRVKELREKYESATVDVAELESEVFSHLYNFFRRYYHEGDFISLRRYKEGVYAIPYEGEEVKLHWANHDQYYIKSSEYLRDYTFILDSGERVRVHLVAASTEQDNKKAAEGKERRFVLCEDEPVYEEKGELFIRFEYRADGEKKKQDALNKAAVDTIANQLKSDSLLASKWSEKLACLAPTEKDKARTVLEKHLSRYTNRHSFDYFIHKDLGGFLRRELDFYIKNEVIHLDDIENENAPRVSQYLSKVKVIRGIAKKIIQFVEQLENFQKRLWLKKKFVVESNYFFTIDHLPEDLLATVANNQQQIQEWERLFKIEPDSISNVAAIKANPQLLVDTKFFDRQFQQAFLANLSNVDDCIDGIMFEADNFHALNLIRKKFDSAVKCIYIDPPYNTGSSAILYKNSFKHSSWCCMMHSRLGLLKRILKEDGALFVSIDKTERARLQYALDDVFGIDNAIEELIWTQNTANSQLPNYSTNHEYVEVYSKNRTAVESDHSMFREPKPGYPEVMELIQKLNSKFPQVSEVQDQIRKLYKKHTSEFKQEMELAGKEWNATTKKLDPWKGIFNYNRAEYRDKNGLLVLDENAEAANAKLRVWREISPSAPASKQSSTTKDVNHKNFRYYKPVHPVTGKPCPHPKGGWKFPEFPDPEKPKRRSFESLMADERIVWGEDETKVPQTKGFLDEVETNIGTSVFYEYNDGEAEVANLFGESGLFLSPKSSKFVRRFVAQTARKNDTVLDCFGGSASSGHAVIRLNDEDNGNRRFVLVEMGHHFDSVTKPRILKALYSSDWSSGKPKAIRRKPHCIKYQKLESYEDALNNLELKKDAQQQLALDDNKDLNEQYTLSYMLDVESRGSQSLLNVNGFRNPDEYKLKVERNGETQLVNVDLVETFNWLLGLTVKHIDVIGTKATGRIRVVNGTNPEGEKVLVLWRNQDDTDNEALEKWFTKQGYNSRDQEYDLIYINGDNNLENLRKDDETWKVRLIEEEFGRLMFDVEDV